MQPVVTEIQNIILIRKKLAQKVSEYHVVSQTSGETGVGEWFWH